MSEIFEITLPTAADPFVTKSVSLEGRQYVISFDWNSRTDRWTVSLSAESGEAILNGALLAVNIDLLRTIPKSLDYVPPGNLIIGGMDDPNLETTGSVSLFYITSQ